MLKYNGVIAGTGWGRGIEPVRPEQISAWFCRVRISPTIAAESNVRYSLDCGVKVHELSAMGVFQLASETAALRKYYCDTEIVGFRTPSELNELFGYFVNKPAERQPFVRNSMARTLAENTYFQRVETLVDILDRNWL
jgi:spore maturation protein CgeB